MEYNDMYFYISHCVGCEPNISRKRNIDSLDKYRIQQGNAFKTRKEAEKEFKIYCEKFFEENGTLVLQESRR